MLGRVFCLALLALVIMQVAVADESAVKVLTEKNAAAELASGKWLLKLYAPWCGHCKRLAPTWDELAAEAGEDVNVGKVDCTVDQKVCQLFNVRGYPTVKLIDGADTYDYRGQRTVADFLEFAREGYTKADKQATPDLSSLAPKTHDEL